MNFNVVDGVVVNFEDIYDDFVDDYVFSTELNNKAIRKKYGLSYSEFKEMADKAKEEYGLTRRPIKIHGAKHYYKNKQGFLIQKTIGGRLIYIGTLPSEELAIRAVEKCKAVSWDVPTCKQIIKEMISNV